MFRPMSLSVRSCFKLPMPSLCPLRRPHRPVTLSRLCPVLRSFSSTLTAGRFVLVSARRFASHSSSLSSVPKTSTSSFDSAESNKAYKAACKTLPLISMKNTPVADLVSGLYAFVDNTEFVPTLANEQSLLLAPSRFGKSTLCEIVRLYHELDADQAQQVFKHTKLGAFIEANKSAHKRRKVIFLELNGFLEITNKKAAVMQAMNHKINQLIVDEARRHGVYDKLIVDSMASLTLKSLIYLLNVPEFGGPPAVIIDEYDAPIMNKLPIGLDEGRLEVMASVFAVLKNGSGKTVHSELVTGVSHIMWRSLSKAANNLTLLSYEPSGERPQLGYTWKQIEHTFKGHIDAYCIAYRTDKETLKKELTAMYNGYIFNIGDSLPLFNPWSIHQFFRSGQLEPHWASSVGLSALSSTLSTTVIDSLLVNGTAFIRRNDLSTDIADLRHFSSNEQLALLVHTGNLTLSRTQPDPREDAFGMSRTLRLQVPNNEVRVNLLPRLLQTIYGLNVTGVLTRRNAELIGAGTLDGLKQVLQSIGIYWKLDTTQKLSSHTDGCHWLEQQISQGVAHIFVFLGTTFKAELPFVGEVLSEARNNTMRRLNLAYTIGSTTHLIEFACKDAQTIDTLVKEKETQVLKYVPSVQRTRPGTKVVAYVAIFDRQASLLSLTRCCETSN